MFFFWIIRSVSTATLLLISLVAVTTRCTPFTAVRITLEGRVETSLVFTHGLLLLSVAALPAVRVRSKHRAGAPRLRTQAALRLGRLLLLLLRLPLLLLLLLLLLLRLPLLLLLLLLLLLRLPLLLLLRLPLLLPLLLRLSGPCAESTLPGTMLEPRMRTISAPRRHAEFRRVIRHTTVYYFEAVGPSAEWGTIHRGVVAIPTERHFPMILVIVVDYSGFGKIKLRHYRLKIQFLLIMLFLL